MKRKVGLCALVLCLLLGAAGGFAEETGMRVLLSDPEVPVLDVWKDGDDFRVLVQEGVGRNGKTQAYLLVWRDFSQGVVGEYTQDNPYLPVFWENADPDWLTRDSDGVAAMLNRYPWQVTWDGKLVRSGTADDAEGTTGLWLISAEEEPVFVHSGTYMLPMVIPGTDEVISTKYRQGEGIVYTEVYSVNLKTFEETVVLGAFPDSIVAHTYLDGKLLVKMVSHEDSDDIVYAIADRETEAVLGITLPLGIALAQVDARPLQSTGTPGEYYIVLENYLEDMAGEHCSIGKLDIHALTFEHLLTLDGLALRQGATWVDEGELMIYSCYDGELLAFPYTVE